MCPNCRYTIPREQVLKAPVFTGDRILVNKFPFEFWEPERWQVIVFKFPEEPKTNYIKRLLGLPGVTGRIVTGGLADLVVLDDDLDVRGTMVGGHWAYRDDSLG